MHHVLWQSIEKIESLGSLWQSILYFCGEGWLLFALVGTKKYFQCPPWHCFIICHLHNSSFSNYSDTQPTRNQIFKYVLKTHHHVTAQYSDTIQVLPPCILCSGLVDKSICQMNKLLNVRYQQWKFKTYSICIQHHINTGMKRIYKSKPTTSTLISEHSLRLNWFFFSFFFFFNMESVTQIKYYRPFRHNTIGAALAAGFSTVAALLHPKCNQVELLVLSWATQATGSNGFQSAMVPLSRFLWKGLLYNMIYLFPSQSMLWKYLQKTKQC